MQSKANEADLAYMRQCIALAIKARASGDYPVGALVVRDHRILGSGIESTRRLLDIAAHAEIEALRSACRETGTLQLPEATMYTTVEPCYMCSFAIRQAGIDRVVIGRPFPTAGGISSHHPILCDPRIAGWGPPPVVVTGVLLDECNALFSSP
ncbi:MAG: nucleoside deaminase [Bryobacteraceae bacterium]